MRDCTLSLSNLYSKTLNGRKLHFRVHGVNQILLKEIKVGTDAFQNIIHIESIPFPTQHTLRHAHHWLHLPPAVMKTTSDEPSSVLLPYDRWWEHRNPHALHYTKENKVSIPWHLQRLRYQCGGGWMEAAWLSWGTLLRGCFEDVSYVSRTLHQDLWKRTCVNKECMGVYFIVFFSCSCCYYQHYKHTYTHTT